jgi:ABC-type branched-subunit amino acid transport system permease subunit
VVLAITRAGWPAWAAFLLAPITAGITGLLIGWFCVRLTRLYSACCRSPSGRSSG